MPAGYIKVTETFICSVCGKESYKDHYAKKYCSKTCALQSQYNKTKKIVLNKGYQLMKRYGMTLDDYGKLLEKQNGTCALCSNTQDLCVDHDHETGTVRGILCRTCNMALGLFKDSPQILQKACTYLNNDVKAMRG